MSEVAKIPQPVPTIQAPAKPIAPLVSSEVSVGPKKIAEIPKKPEPKAKLNNIVSHATVVTKQQDTAIEHAQPFIRKLWDIVNEKSDIVGWNGEGNRIIVRQQEKFAKEVLPRYFRTSNLSSFRRQLSYFGFKKTLLCDRTQRQQERQFEYQHKWFVRGRPDWLVRILRKRCNVQLTSEAETLELRNQLAKLKQEAVKQENQLVSDKTALSKVSELFSKFCEQASVEPPSAAIKKQCAKHFETFVQKLPTTKIATETVVAPANVELNKKILEPGADVKSSVVRAQPFIRKLWDIVNEKSDIVGWNIDGKRIIVHDQDKFAKEVLPRYFRTSILSSFRRQLSYFGFKKTLLVDRNQQKERKFEYQHKWFVKGRPDYLVRILRKRCNRQTSEVETTALRNQLARLQQMLENKKQQLISGHQLEKVSELFKKFCNEKPAADGPDASIRKHCVELFQLFAKTQSSLVNSTAQLTAQKRPNKRKQDHSVADSRPKRPRSRPGNKPLNDVETVAWRIAGSQVWKC